MAVGTEEWLRLIRDEYAVPFIAAGGAAVKFAIVANPALIPGIDARLDDVAHASGLVRVRLDAASVKLHMIQDVFFAIARELDWCALAQRHLERVFAENGREWPRPGQPMPVRELADAYGVHESLVDLDIQRWLTRSLLRDASMTQDFRSAMARLCQDRLAAGDSGEPVAPVIEWLRGEIRIISALRSAQIYTKITRQNARGMLRSLCRWLRLCGEKGLLLSIDADRLARAMPAGSSGVRYTPASVLDAYEVLRQLIDDADHMEGALVIVLADLLLMNAQDAKRSIASYPALKMRIWDDVRDRTRDNPVAPLVILADGAAA
jgi:hypothetical protein